jgi:hypothetical protein
MDQCKTNYEALNSQLVEELPKLLEISTKLYTNCVTEFILLRKLFVGRVTKELLSLMDVRATIYIYKEGCLYVCISVCHYAFAGRWR